MSNESPELNQGPTDKHPVFVGDVPTGTGTLGTSATSTAIAQFFDTPTRTRARVVGALLLLPTLLALVTTPLSPNPVVGLLAALSAATELAVAAALFNLGRVHPERQERLYAILVHVSLIVLWPLVYFFGIHGPVAGVGALVVMAYSLDAPRRAALLATLSITIPHSVASLLMANRLLPRLSLAQPDIDPQLELVNAGTIPLFYFMGFAFARLFRRRTERDLEELAEAGRMVAARDALLREARQELQRAAVVGEPGRFSGQELGSFLLGNLLGRGGMGEVYEASHTSTGMPAAVKLLRLPEHDGSSMLQRFEREAAIVKRLSSPHVATVYEVAGLEAPLPYIAMERLEGKDCTQILRQRKLTGDEVVDMVEQVGKALVEAKRHGVVHRDIKPSNLFRTKSGQWKVLDFGIARLAGQSGTLTGGGLVGTFGYLAPEQLGGERAVTHQTDVHALAVVAYRALTGRPAFTKRDPAEAMEEVQLSLPPRPSSLIALPSAVDDVLLIALAKRPKDRFPDAMELASALRRAMRGDIYAEIADKARAVERDLDWSIERPSGAPSRAPQSTMRGARRRR